MVLVEKKQGPTTLSALGPITDPSGYTLLFSFQKVRVGTPVGYAVLPQPFEGKQLTEQQLLRSRTAGLASGTCAGCTFVYENTSIQGCSLGGR